MYKVYVEDLPKWGKEGHGREGSINWIESANTRAKLRFEYNEICGKFIITDYDVNKSRVGLIYNDEYFNIKTGHLVNCHLGKIVGCITKKFKFDIGYHICDKDRDMIITDRKYSTDSCGRTWKVYKFKCNKCGFESGKHYKNGELIEEYWLDEYNLIKGIDCSCCGVTPKIIVEGINDIPTTAPWMVKYFKNQKDICKYTKSSGKKAHFMCPDCLTEKYIGVNGVYRNRSVGCFCNDNISYPEKYIKSLLNNLNINYIYQYAPNWAKGKRYDFYIPSLEIIIEANGMQHYRDSSGMYKRTLKEESENDNNKKLLAVNNNIKEYIVIDCRYSNSEWIKASILSSRLNDIYDLSNINWNSCDEVANSNLVKLVCDLKNKDNSLTTSEIELLTGVKQGVVNNYLKRGTKLGWCKYDPKEEMKRSGHKSGKLFCKPVEIFKDGISLGIFSSARELDDKSEELFDIKLSYKSISSVCTGKIPHYKGYIFKFVNNKE